MTDDTLRARVRAAIQRHASTEALTDAVLAAIPEPAPVVRSHQWKDAGWRKAILCDSVGRIIARIESSVYATSAHLTRNAPYEQLGDYDTEENARAACERRLLALRDGPNAKDAQIAALTKRLGVERDAVAFWREQCDVRERGLKTVEAELAALTQRAEAAERENAHYDIKVELAALKTKAGTPTCLHDWHSYSDTAGTHSRCLRCGMVPGLEAPPTPAEYPVIGHAVIRSSGSVVQGWWLNGRNEMALEHSARAVELAEERGAIAYQLLRGEVVP